MVAVARWLLPVRADSANDNPKADRTKLQRAAKDELICSDQMLNSGRINGLLEVVGFDHGQTNGRGSSKWRDMKVSATPIGADDAGGATTALSNAATEPGHS